MKEQSKETSLSEKRHDPYGYGNYEYPEEDVKEKIQNAERRLKEVLIKWDYRITSEVVIEEIDKIFLEEFGRKLR